MVEPSDAIKGLVIGDAKFNCIKHAANFFRQASAEGRLDEFFDAVNQLYLDRWPNDIEVNLEDVYSLSSSLFAVLTCTIATSERGDRLDCLRRRTPITLGSRP